tara:strand:- start:95 stop:253 length:159 start_codon:yes stop_codon:yes gene_type:complete
LSDFRVKRERTNQPFSRRIKHGTIEEKHSGNLIFFLEPGEGEHERRSLGGYA